jgi:hypothetical protein
MENNNTENLGGPEGQDGWKPGGGDRIKAKATQAGDKLKQQGVKVAKEAAKNATKAALIASGVGAGLAAVGGKAAEWLTEKVLNKGWWKLILLNQLAPIIGVLLLITLCIVPAFARIGKSNKCWDGKCPANSTTTVSISNEADIAELQSILGNSGIDYAAIRSWWFSQGYKHEAAAQAWYSHPYGSGKTIGSSGCGPTAAAMVLKKYGQNVTPLITADFCLANGYRVDGVGTSADCFMALAKKYGLKAEVISSWDAAKKVLQAGQPLIISVGGTSASKYFVSGSGHFIVLAGIYGDTVLINDSGPRNRKVASVSQVTGSVKNSSYYYIHP